MYTLNYSVISAKYFHHHQAESKEGLKRYENRDLWANNGKFHAAHDLIPQSLWTMYQTGICSSQHKLLCFLICVVSKKIF